MNLATQFSTPLGGPTGQYFNGTESETSEGTNPSNLLAGNLRIGSQIPQQSTQQLHHLQQQLQQLQLQQQLQNQNQKQDLGENYQSIPVEAGVSSSVHWKHQTQLAFVSRKCNIPHYYARHAANVSRNKLESAPVTEISEPTEFSEVSGEDGVTLIEVTKKILTSVVKEAAAAAAAAAATTSVGTPTLTNAVIARKSGAHEADAEDEEAEDQRIRIRENNTQLWTGLDLSGQMMQKVSDKLFRYAFLRRLYLNGNKLKVVPRSIGQLKSLRVLDLSHNELQEVPSEMGMLFNLRYLYLFDNELKEVPASFGNLVSLEFLGVEGNINLDREVVNTIAKKGTRGLIIHLRDDCIKLDPPKERKWIDVGEDEEVTEDKPASEVDLKSSSPRSFTVMSYNTLCQHYATAKMYKYTPAWALNWEYRRAKLAEEILSYSTNVVCLQEVESRTYEEYWVPLLEKAGYKGTFHCKSRAKTMGEKGAKRVDGCATFYKTDTFQLVERRVVEYGKAVLSGARFPKTDDVFNRLLNKDNIALVTVLQHVTSGETVVVANTHLHWDPEYNDVKAMQVAVLLEELQPLAKKHSNMVVCGDFNSQRGSAVHELISEGLSHNHGDLRGRDYGAFTKDGLSHPFHLRSAYDVIGELPFTNFTPAFTEVIDYIWYSNKTLQVKGVLGGPDEEYTRQVLGFPTAHWPSDHISLITRLEFRRSGGSGGKRVKADFGGSRKT